MSTPNYGYTWPGPRYYEAPPPAYAAAPYQADPWNAYPPPAAIAPYQDDVFSEVLAEMAAQDPGCAAQFNLLPSAQPPIYPAVPQANMMFGREMPNVLREALEHWERRKNEPTAPAGVTDKQMKALGRTHLILMLRDTQAELDQIKRDHEALLTGLYAALVLQAGGGP